MTSSRPTSEPLFLDALAGGDGTSDPVVDMSFSDTFPDALSAPSTFDADGAPGLQWVGSAVSRSGSESGFGSAGQMIAAVAGVAPIVTNVGQVPQWQLQAQQRRAEQVDRLRHPGPAAARPAFAPRTWAPPGGARGQIPAVWAPPGIPAAQAAAIAPAGQLAKRPGALAPTGQLAGGPAAIAPAGQLAKRPGALAPTGQLAGGRAAQTQGRSQTPSAFTQAAQNGASRNAPSSYGSVQPFASAPGYAALQQSAATQQYAPTPQYSTRPRSGLPQLSGRSTAAPVPAVITPSQTVGHRIFAGRQVARSRARRSASVQPARRKRGALGSFILLIVLLVSGAGREIVDLITNLINHR